MTTAFDVPPEALLRAAAETLRKDEKVAAPEWAKSVKTGVHREKAPTTSDWWHVRVAGILRQVYIHGPIGVEHISARYGGPRDRGSRPNSARSGSGSIVRAALQRLEAGGYVQSIKGKGRVTTGKGRSLMDNAAHSVVKTLEAKLPELAKY